MTHIENPKVIPTARVGLKAEQLGDRYVYRFSPPLSDFVARQIGQSLHHAIPEKWKQSTGFMFIERAAQVGGRDVAEIGLQIWKTTPQRIVDNMFRAINETGLAHIQITTEKYWTPPSEPEKGREKTHDALRVLIEPSPPGDEPLLTEPVTYRKST